MPLLPGKKNLFRNAQVEMNHGKPRDQAFAIAYSVLAGRKVVGDIRKGRNKGR